MHFKSLKSRFISGLGLIALVLLFSTVYMLNQLNEIKVVSDRVNEVRTPTVIHSFKLLSSVAQMNAASSAWLNVKNDELLVRYEKNKRKIQQILNSIDEISPHWTNTKNIERLNKFHNLYAQILVLDKTMLSINSLEEKNQYIENKTRLMNEIEQILLEMTSNQEFLILDDAKVNHESTSEIMNIQLMVLTFGLLAILFIGVVLYRSINRPIQNIVKQSEKVKMGKLDVSLPDIQLIEINKLNIAFQAIITKFKKIEDISSQISVGNYEQNIDLDSKHDKLAMSINSMCQNLKDLTCANQDENWLKSGQAEFSAVIQSEEDLNLLLKKSIEYICKYVDGQVGTIYIVDKACGTIALSGSYAFTSRKKLKKSFDLNEGLVGQVVEDQKAIILSDVPEGYMQINSTLGEIAPNFIAAIPVKYNNMTNAVIEIGFIREIDSKTMTLLNSLSENLAIAINVCQDRKTVKDLLEESQTQAEELEQQKNDLEHMNQELELQASAIKNSEAELTAQSENLKEVNCALEAKTESLNQQRTEIEQKNKDLEKKQIELIEKTRKLEESSKYKSEFLANMSHELRTPLNSLLILSEDLLENEEENLNEDQLGSIDVIHKSGNNLLTLINDILDLSKVEAGKLNIDIKPTQISEIGAELQELFGKMCSKKNIHFNIEIEDDLPQTIKTDHLRLQQVLKNIVSNAIKFTKKGSVNIMFEKDKHIEDALLIKVVDTGIGIPNHKQKDIFDAFAQIDGSISREHNGTGLGLTISLKLIKMLGGQINLSSKENEGSTFTVSIPFECKENIAQDEQAALFKEDKEDNKAKPMLTSNVAEPVVTEQSIQFDLSNNISKNEVDNSVDTIVIIEDDLVFANKLVKIAKNYNFKALIAENGSKGLELIKAHQPKAIILDLGLPDMNGTDLYEKLKSDETTKDIPIHISTCRDIDSLLFKKDSVDVLCKPASKNEIQGLFENISSMLNVWIKNVLLIEDDLNSQKAIQKTISKNNQISVTAVTTGEKALALLKSKEFDCIILDLNLPDMTGFDLLKTLSEGNEYNHAPVIVHTGKELSSEEYIELNQYTSNIILKVNNASERLTEEVALFLRNVKPESFNAVINIDEYRSKEKSLKGKNVLLVDDDMRNVYSMSKILKKQGLNVTIAGNGKMALKKIQEMHQFDIILMDIMMPEMDGYEAMNKIREIEAYKDIPILALTAKTMAKERQVCKDNGASEYLAKPVRMDKLMGMMKVWFDHYASSH